jgi:hypothetical protein
MKGRHVPEKKNWGGKGTKNSHKSNPKKKSQKENPCKMFSFLIKKKNRHILRGQKKKKKKLPYLFRQRVFQGLSTRTKQAF